MSRYDSVIVLLTPAMPEWQSPWNFVLMISCDPDAAGNAAARYASPPVTDRVKLKMPVPTPAKPVCTTGAPNGRLRLVRSARPGTGASNDTDRFIAWGPGPRASQALMLAVRAKALIDGRLAPSVDDVLVLAEPVLKHRMALTFAARAEGIQMSDMVARLVKPLG